MRNLILVAIGLAGGALIVAASHSIWHQSGEQDTAVLGVLLTDAGLHQTVDAARDSRGFSLETREQKAKAELDRAAPASTLAERDTKSLDSLQSDLSKQVSNDSMGRAIPDVYSSMVKPRPRPEKLTTPELYESFEGDSRDESWAYPMELGINQYIAERGGVYGAAFEYVECRSRYCTIAGVVHGGGQETVNEFMAEMTQSGWWQTYGGRSTVGSRNDTEYRFVSIIPRAEEDTARSESAAQSVQKGTSNKAQSADS